jgi:hypothetical protein
MSLLSRMFVGRYRNIHSRIDVAIGHVGAERDQQRHDLAASADA